MPPQAKPISSSALEAASHSRRTRHVSARSERAESVFSAFRWMTPVLMVVALSLTGCGTSQTLPNLLEHFRAAGLDVGEPKPFQDEQEAAESVQVPVAGAAV